MPQLSDNPAAKFVKVVIPGLSGTRKTTGLGSLARAGYNLYIVDCDNGLGALTSELRGDAKALGRVQFESCWDKMKNVSGSIVTDGKPTGWISAMKVLTDWPGKGPLEKWTDSDVLVIDTLTTLGQAAMRYVLNLSGHDKPSLPDFGTAMDLIERLVQMLSMPSANCHVVVNTHVNYTENADGSGVIEGFPSALGNKLSPKIPIYFDNVLVAKKQGKGETAKFTYELRGDGMVMGKSSYRGATSLDNATGLAEFFKQLRNGKEPPH